MHKETVQFIQSPNKETYVALREKVIASDDFDPYSREIETAGELFDQQKINEAGDILREAMPNLILSAFAHQFLGLIFHKLGDEEGADMEIIIGDACIEGILATGDGSESAPYLILRTTDEGDILKHFGKEGRLRSLVQKDGKYFDVLQCTDDSEYWFDVTDAHRWLSKSLRKRTK